MNNKAMVTLVVVVIIIAAGVIWFAIRGTDTTTTNSNTQSATTNTNAESTISANTNTQDSLNTNQANTNSAPTLNGQQGQYSGEPGVEGPDTQVFEVKYDGTSFSPKTLSIKAGDVVVFKNESSSAFRPASGPHPAHTNYPEFDPKVDIAAGKSWSFTFTKVGTWPYHNHLNPSVFGTITVTK
jgi:plastocyanin